eukprot:TRINITY_DN3499_c0_g1_i1.p2 TRINITY_DN3499_c0_g1~~TRINITY_DN3499_c0_g1_i1.p2  ORF type:complete len:51 (-),score=2.06 TRINITY_DN3499_c0_g1_i1:218-370(-)
MSELNTQAEEAGNGRPSGYLLQCIPSSRWCSRDHVGSVIFRSKDDLANQR